MDMSNRIAVLNKLRSFISESRADKFHRVASNRTKLIKVVIEDVYQDRNAGAVFRTCDCFGIYQLAVINNLYCTKVARDISKGAEKWLEIETYNSENKNNTIACINDLKQNGYEVVATTPNDAEIELPEFEITGKTAILFGTEMAGLSADALALADKKLRIPIYGFTESFNISVSAALTLQSVVAKMHKSALSWQLPEDEQIEMEIAWILKSLGERRQDILKLLEIEN